MSNESFLEPILVVDPSAVAGDRMALAASGCRPCDRIEFPRRAECPACGTATDDVELTDGAVLSGATSVLHPPPGAQVETPYHIGVAAFPGGISVLGQLVVDDLGDAPLGTPLEVVAVPVGEALGYGFRPA